MADEGNQMGRGLKILLYTSVTLNLLIVGVIAGLALSGGPSKDRRVERNDTRGFSLVRALPRESRSELRKRFQDKHAERASSGAESPPSKDEILSTLRQTPFDPQAFGEVVSAQTRMLAERGRLGQEALIEQVSEMSDDERRAYADRVEKAFSRRRAPREKRDH